MSQLNPKNSVAPNPFRGRILVVCEANICRSVIGSGVLRAGLTESVWSDVEIDSAGVAVLEPQPACGLVMSCIGEIEGGVVYPQRKSQRLTTDLINGADLILTAERKQRSAIVTVSPLAVAKTFTLNEAAALLRAVRADTRDAQRAALGSLNGLVAALGSHRGYARYPDVQHSGLQMLVPKLWRAEAVHPLDIVDGHVRGGRAHIRTVDAVMESASQVVQLLAAPVG